MSEVQRESGLVEAMANAYGRHDLAQWALNVERERDRYREALRRISDANSGHWGKLAHEALHGTVEQRNA